MGVELALCLNIFRLTWACVGHPKNGRSQSTARVCCSTLTMVACSPLSSSQTRAIDQEKKTQTLELCENHVLPTLKLHLFYSLQCPWWSSAGSLVRWMQMNRDLRARSADLSDPVQTPLVTTFGSPSVSPLTRRPSPSLRLCRLTTAAADHPSISHYGTEHRH